MAGEAQSSASQAPEAAPRPAEAARRNLSAGRLRRLLEISALVRRNPRLRMNDILERLGVSRSQFYRDRDELLRLGFHFGRRSRLQGFTLAQDPLLPPVEMAVSELLSLSAAVAALARAGHTETAYLALRSLLAVTARLPAPMRAALEPFVEEVVLGEGFGCPLPVLEVLQQAIGEGRRIVIGLGEAQTETRTMTIDPQAIVAHQGALHLRGLDPERGQPALIPLAAIRQAGFTPFLAPEPPAQLDGEP